VAEPLELPLQAVAARAGLITEAQLTPIPSQTFRQLGDDLGPVREDPELPDLATPDTLRYRHVDRRLVDVHADKRDAAHQARSPSVRLGTGWPGATLVRCMPRARAASLSSRTSGLGPHEKISSIVMHSDVIVRSEEVFLILGEGAVLAADRA
jgi:hypothetical protein